MKKAYKEWIHYIFVYAIVVLAFWQIMTYAGLWVSIVITFFAFWAADKIAHKVILREK